MAKKNNVKRNRKDASNHALWPEVRNSIFGVILFATGLVLLLAAFDLAGPVGWFLYQSFSALFGWGYFLLPALFFIFAAVLIRSVERTFYLPIFLGGSLMAVAILGIFHEIEPEKAGLLGKVVGSLSYLFGLWATVVILLTLGLIGFFMTFNVGLTQKPTKKEDQEQESSAPILVAAPPLESPGAEEGKPTEKIPKTVTTSPRLETSPDLLRADKIPGRMGAWQYPPIDLLEPETSRPTSGDVRANANIIKRTLENFGIPVEMSEINIGPTVTQYTLKPAQGVKLSKIVALQNDLSLALASHPIRIEAPIPGKSLVGIEVPNRHVALVRLKNLFQEKTFGEHHSPLAFALGRDVMGIPMYADLSRMPHLLIAGATGTGKSIFIHGMLAAFLFRNSPHELRLILIDPKRVELSMYQGIPHLLTPVITQGKQTLVTFRWAIGEMERRYDILLEADARDIFSYNEKFRDRDPARILPFIVIMIDELADLMAAYGREIEGSIVRLAQMARATGIHLVVSTQRPSVEVITGLIKANITSRIAFQVASQVDSRTILDMAGAEKLLGNGDLLYIAADTSKPKRIQAPYVAEAESKRLVGFVRRQEDISGELPEEVEALQESLEGEEEENRDLSFSEEELDPLYEDARRVVIEAKKASASLLQRRLKIGYARAARLLDMMEERGLIGPGDGAKPREVKILSKNEE